MCSTHRKKYKCSLQCIWYKRDNSRKLMMYVHYDYFSQKPASRDSVTTVVMPDFETKQVSQVVWIGHQKHIMFPFLEVLVL